VDHFAAEGVASLSPSDVCSPEDRRCPPADSRYRIRALKAEYPAFRPYEVAETGRRRDDCRVSHKVAQCVLAQGPPGDSVETAIVGVRVAKEQKVGIRERATPLLLHSRRIDPPH